MIVRTLLAATALAPPVALHAQSMPGMDMGAHQHHAPPTAKPKPAPAAPSPKPTTRRRAAAAPRPTKPAPAVPPRPDTAPATHTPMDMPMDMPMEHGSQPTSPGADPHAGMDAGAMDRASTSQSAAPGLSNPMAGMQMGGAGMAGMDMQGMKGMLGGYGMVRDASGTAWQPDSSPMWAIMGQHGPWSTMVPGYATLVYDKQGGPRGNDKTFVASMFMVMGQRPVGAGTLTLKAMSSLDPLMGKSGYPLLLATGETADGRTELVDRQHPHDAFMELSATYRYPLSGDLSGFVYLGLPGEPALGPATYMHRFSGMANPEAPIAHHWLHSTHVTFGVATTVWSTRA